MRALPALLLALLLGAGHTATAEILYSVTDLGTLGGDSRGLRLIPGVLSERGTLS